MEAVNKFEVFYDEQCPLCRREVDMIRRKDKLNRLILTDISSSSFDVLSTGRTLDELMREIHGRKSDGTWVKGPEVFREIYERLGFGKFVIPTRWPVVRQLMSFGYKLFARLRYYSAVRRMKRESKA